MERKNHFQSVIHVILKEILNRGQMSYTLEMSLYPLTIQRSCKKEWFIC